jgi:LPS-assembly lipoprotein
MSWFSRLAPLAAMSLALSGCGFTPLYSESAHPGIIAATRAIEIVPIKDRIGHYLGEDLIHELNDTGEALPPVYRLTVTVTLTTQTPTIESQIGAASAATTIGDAQFKLVRIADSVTIIDAKAEASAVYDRTEQRFADERASRVHAEIVTAEPGDRTEIDDHAVLVRTQADRDLIIGAQDGP